jgi:hypothetical protein
MEMLWFLFGAASLVATVLLGFVSVPKKDRRTLHVALVIVGCVTGGAALIVQSVLSITGARETQTLLTGGDGYAYVVPQTKAPDLPLTIYNPGEHALPGVAVEIVDMNFDHGIPPTLPEIEVGTIPAHRSRLLKASFTPTPGADGEASYMFLISAANGLVTQSMQFRRGGYALPWAYKFVVVRQIRIDDQHGRGETLKMQGWSDDLGEGKATSDIAGSSSTSP